MTPEDLGSGEFQINDVILNIPPEQIRVSRQSINHRWQTLRTRSSIKVKSGFSVIDISIVVKFTDTWGLGNPAQPFNNGYEQLQALIAQFRVTPFCYVENKFLRDAVLGSDNSQNMALALKQMEIRAPSQGVDPVTGRATKTNNVIEVYFNFAWFNYFPFSRNFKFKKDIFDPTEEEDPTTSEAWKRMWRAELRRGHYRDMDGLALTEGTPAVTFFKFRQYASLAPGKFQNLKKELDVLKKYEEKAKRSWDGQGMQIPGRESAPTAVALLKELEQEFGESRAADIRDILMEVGTSMFGADGSKERTADQELADILANDLVTAKLVNYHAPPGAEADGYGEWSPVVNQDGKIIKFKSDPTLEKEINKPEKKTESDTVLLERPVHLYFNDNGAGGNGMIVTSLSISFENILATMPLIGHPYPSYQHIGSVDAVLTMSIMTTRDKGVQALSEFYSIIEDQAFKHRMAPQGQRNVWVDDPLVNACGLFEFIPESLTFDTVPGQPGTTMARLVMVDSPISAHQREEIVPGQSFTTTQEVRSEIARILLNNLKREMVKIPSGWFDRNWKILTGKLRTFTYAYSPQAGTASDTPRDERFKKLCVDFGAKLGETIRGLEKVVEGANNDSELGQLSELYSLTNKDIVAIETMQKDLWDNLIEYKFRSTAKRLDGGRRPKIKSLQEMKKTAIFNISRSDQQMVSEFQDTQALRESMQLAEDDVGGIMGTAEGLITSTMREGNFYWLGRVSRFIAQYLYDWLKWVTPFLDRILLSGHIEMEQFASVRKMMAQGIGVGTSGHCYPDFPLKEVIEDLAQYDPSAYQKLEDLASQLQLPQKNIPVSAMIGPDFYFSNKADSIHRIIAPEVMAKAKEAILESQKQMQTAEKTWVEQSYTGNLLGASRSEKVRLDLANTKGWDLEGVANEETAKAMKRLVEGSSVFHPDDLQGDEPVYSCLAASKESGQDVEAHKIGTEEDPHNAIGARRAAKTMEPVDNYKELQHRFGADAIDFVAAHTLSPTTPSDPSKTPEFVWPVQGGKPAAQLTGRFGDVAQLRGNKPHKGIDIVSSADASSYPQQTVKTVVVAAAKGVVVSVGGPITEQSGSLKFVNAYWRLKGTGDQSATPVLYKQGPNKGKPIISGDWERVEGPKPKDQGASITIDHGGGWKTLYGHLQWEETYKEIRRAFLETPKSQRKDHPLLNLEAGTAIGKIGTSGYSTGPHLHFETRYNDGWYDPEKVLAGEYNKNQGPTKVMDPTNESLLTRSVDQLEKELVNGQGYSMARAYPTFRLYFIESDLGERKRFAFDDFFSYSSVKEIQVIRSRKIAADLCMISMTNVSGVLSNRKFRSGRDGDKPRSYAFGEGDGSDQGPPQEIAQSPQRANTRDENRIASLMLQPGIQVQLRLGYNNNPEELDKVFNGVITDVQFGESDDLVNIVCQSFAIELTQVMKGNKKKSFGGFLSSSGRTAAILEEMLTAPEVVHFGRWEPSGHNSPYSTLLSNRWEFTPKPYDDNIFAPTGKGWRGIWDSTAKYIADETTIWDVFQEMTLRHPGYVACAVPYEGKFGPRMTMFFGCPEQMYTARDSTFKEDNVLEGFKNFLAEAQEDAKKYEDQTPKDLQDADAVVSYTEVKNKMDERSKNSAFISSRDFWLNKLMKNYALDKGIFKPFRSYHVLTSTLHIIHNSINSTSYECFNTVTLRYRPDWSVLEKVTGYKTLNELLTGEFDSFTLKCDAGLSDEDVREVFTEFSNCVGYEMAKRYAVGTLFQTMKEGYKGSMVIVGNAAIKPYDICYIFDEYSDMFGPIEVEQVVHRFSQDNGFITEITPDMVVHVNRISTLSTSDAMGLAVETALKKLDMQSLPSVKQNSSRSSKGGAAVMGEAKAKAGAGSTLLEYAFAPIANMFYNSTENSVGSNATTNPFGLLGIFIFRKMVTRSQLAHPFRYSPLVKNGKPMLGGLPSKKTDGSFIQGIRKWAKEADEGIPLWLEDTYDRIKPSTWWSPSWGDFGAWFSGTERHGEFE